MLSISNLTLSRSGTRVYESISLDLDEGVNVLAGENGSGKTTLMMAFATLLKPDSGSITLDGTTYTRSTEEDIRSRIGYQGQFANFPGSFTVRQAIDYAAWLRKVPKESRQRAVNHAIEQANVGSFAEQKIGTLSGGMARRVFLAQAIVHQPRLILLDEPSSGLDPIQQEHIDKVIIALSAHAIVVVSSHSVDEISRLGGRLVILSHGNDVRTIAPSDNNLSPDQIRERLVEASWQ